MSEKIQITFRISKSQLARGLEIIQLIEPNYHPSSLSQMVRLIYNDYLAKMGLMLPMETSPKALNEVNGLIQHKTKSRISEDIFSDLLNVHIVNTNQKGDK